MALVLRCSASELTSIPVIRHADGLVDAEASSDEQELMES